MPKSELEQKKEYIEWLISPDNPEKVDSDRYAAVLANLRILVNKTNDINKNDGNLNATDRSDLERQYGNLIKACNDLIYNPENRYARQHRNIAENLKRIAVKDFNVITGMDKENPGNLKDAVVQARSYTVDITNNKNFSKALRDNNKLAMKTSSGTKGYFVPKESNTYEDNWLAAIDICVNKVSAQYKPAIEQLKTSPELLEAFSDAVIADESKYLEKEDQDYQLGRAAVALDLCDNVDAGKVLMNEDPDLRSALLTLAREGNSLLPSVKNMRDTGMNSYQRIDNRSAAVFEVAKLINCEKIITKASPMIVVNGPGTIEGTFTEAPDGTDLNNLKENDPLFSCDPASFRAEQFRKQAYQLQVLDYICGNTERKNDNIIYDISGNPPQAKGIHALSSNNVFGSADYSDIDSMPRKSGFVHPLDMVYLDEKTADAIEKLDKDVFKTVLLNYDLSEEQFEAAWNRVLAVKTAILNKDITVVKDSEWAALQINPDEKINFAETMISNLEVNVRNKQFNRNAAERQFEEAGLDGIRSELYLSNRQIRNMVRKMRSADNFYMGSTEFNAMRDSLYTLGVASERISERFKRGIMPDQKDIEYMETLRNDLSEKTNSYMIAKGSFQRTEHGRDRFNLASEISSMTGNLDSMINMSKDSGVQKQSTNNRLTAIEALIPFRQPLVGKHLEELIAKSNDIPQDQFNNYMECLEYVAGIRQGISDESKAFFKKNLEMPELLDDIYYKQEMSELRVPDTLDVNFSNTDRSKNGSSNTLNAMYDNFEKNNPDFNREEFIIIGNKSVKELLKNDETYKCLDEEGKKRMVADVVDRALLDGLYVEVFCPEQADMLAHDPIALSDKEIKANKKRIAEARDRARKENKERINPQAPRKNSLKKGVDKFKETVASKLINMRQVAEQQYKIEESTNLMFFGDVDKNSYLKNDGDFRGRQSPGAVCMGILASEGHSMEDILDPTKLVDKKKEVGQLYLQKRKDKDIKWYAEQQVKGTKAINKCLKDHIIKYKKEFVNPSAMPLKKQADFHFFKNLSMDFSQEAEFALKSNADFYNGLGEPAITSAETARKYFYSYQDTSQFLGDYRSASRNLMGMNDPMHISEVTLAEYQISLIEEQLFIKGLANDNPDLSKLEVPFDNHSNLLAPILETEEFKKLSDGTLSNTEKFKLIQSIESGEFANKYSLENKYLGIEEPEKEVKKEEEAKKEQKEKEKENEDDMELGMK